MHKEGERKRVEKVKYREGIGNIMCIYTLICREGWIALPGQGGINLVRAPWSIFFLPSAEEPPSSFQERGSHISYYHFSRKREKITRWYMRKLSEAGEEGREKRGKSGRPTFFTFTILEAFAESRVRLLTSYSLTTRPPPSPFKLSHRILHSIEASRREMNPEVQFPKVYPLPEGAGPHKRG